MAKCMENTENINVTFNIKCKHKAGCKANLPV